jgi:hypothetical protein
MYHDVPSTQGAGGYGGAFAGHKERECRRENINRLFYFAEQPDDKDGVVILIMNM